MLLPHPLRDPWLITQGGLEIVLAIASRDEFFAEVRERALAARDGRPLQNTHAVSMRDGVAVVPVQGVLCRHADMLSEVSGATSYEQLRKDLEVALTSPECKAILFDFDSPGGEAKGCFEMADAIFAARGRKPLVAYVGGTCASAAYRLAAACDEIVCAEAAQLGSIGVVVALIDDRKADEAQGIKRIEIVSSQSPKKRLDPDSADDLARLQGRIDQLAALFIEGVARDRDVDADEVAEDFGQGDVMLGGPAVKAGLADRIGNFESTLAELAARTRQPQGARMDSKALAKLLALDESASEQQITERLAALTAFERATCAAAGTTNPDEALGKMRAGVDALGELATLRAARDAEQASGRRAEFRALLEGAVKAGGLTLGEVANVVPTFLDDEAAAQVAQSVEQLATQTEETVLAAVCATNVSAKSIARTKAYVGAKAPAPAAPRREPPLDEKNREAVFTVSKEEAAKYGLRPETVGKLYNVKSVDQIDAAKKGA